MNWIVRFVTGTSSSDISQYTVIVLTTEKTIRTLMKELNRFPSNAAETCITGKTLDRQVEPCGGRGMRSVDNKATAELTSDQGASNANLMQT